MFGGITGERNEGSKNQHKALVSGTIRKDMALESEKPAVQRGNVKTVWLCQERLCFQGLITAF